LAATALLVRWFVVQIFLEQVLVYNRLSPTHIFEDCILLSQSVSWIAAKDSSRYSIPADHAYVLFTAALYLTYSQRGRFALLAWLLAVAGSVPRIVAGAHWLSDILVGSLSLALLATAVVMATPLHDKVLLGLRWVMRPASYGVSKTA
jgi:membrane-associated phospholipid phosphatase